MKDHNLIRCIFCDPQEAIRFFLQLKVVTVANDESSCTATLEKVDDEMWTYILQWQDGKFVGEHLRPFRPSIDNLAKFNKGCEGMADLLDQYIKTGELPDVTTNESPFGDLALSHI